MFLDNEIDAINHINLGWMQTHYDYPDLVILDIRFPRTDYIQYDISNFERM